MSRVPAASPRSHGGQLLTDLLLEQGVDTVFGLPGGQGIAFYDGVSQRSPRIRHVLVRDERSAAYAADSYARLSGRIGVCDATVGPGTAKLPSGLGEALNSSIPVLAIVSELPASSALHGYRGAASQALDQRALLQPVTKWLAQVPDLHSLPGLVRQAFRAATTGRPGPAALIISQDVFDARLEPGDEHEPSLDEICFGRFPALRAAPDPSFAAAAAELLIDARRPLLLLGGGSAIAAAGPAAASLAEALDAAIVTSLSAKGAVSESHPLHAGVLGSIGTPAAATLIEEADAVVMIGTKTSASVSFGWTLPRRDQIVVQIDVDPLELGRAAPTDIPILADARLGAEALIGAVGAAGEPPPPVLAERQDWRARIAELTADWRSQRDAERAAAGAPIAPQRVMGALQSLLSAEDVVLCDASLASGWGGVYLEQPEPGRRFLFPRGLAGLGWAVPAAIGAAMARPSSRLVVVVGDGGFSYAVGELATLAQYRLPVTILVLNNSSLGWIRWYRRIHLGSDSEKPDFDDVDFAAVGRAYGLTASRVTEPEQLIDSISEALQDEGPSLVDVVSDVWQTPLFGHREALGQEAEAVGYMGD